jgi:hypothetical protein
VTVPARAADIADTATRAKAFSAKLCHAAGGELEPSPTSFLAMFLFRRPSDTLAANNGLMELSTTGLVLNHKALSDATT